jgi:hypothetical protein
LVSAGLPHSADNTHTITGLSGYCAGSPGELPPPTPLLFVRLMHSSFIIPKLLGDSEGCLASVMRDAHGLGSGVHNPHLQGISKSDDFRMGGLAVFGALILSI